MNIRKFQDQDKGSLISLWKCVFPNDPPHEHLQVQNAGHYYPVQVRRAHGNNLVGTIERSFGNRPGVGQTVLIQFVAQTELADAVCAMEFDVDQTCLLKARFSGGALQISRFNRHNVPAIHERFPTYVQDIKSAPAY